MNTELRDNVGKLLLDTGRAHHKAFEVTDGADPEWPEFYANEIIEHFAPSETPAEDKLVLYHFDGCPSRGTS